MLSDLSIKLNNQELLNVMYRGELIDSLNIASKEEIVDKLFGNRPVLKKRFGYHEILLRAKVIEGFVNSDDCKLRAAPTSNGDRDKEDPRSILAENAATAVAEAMSQIIQREVNRQPTIKIKPGYRFMIFVQRDILFPAAWR